MGKTEMKRNIVLACISSHKKTIDNIREAMEEAQKGADEADQELDIYDSNRAQLYRKHDMFAQQLQKALDQLKVFNKIDPDKINEEVTFGSIVKTNKQNIFVSTSVGKITLNGETYFTISPMVPFYQAMKGMKKGDEFEFRNQKFKILDLF